MKKMLTFAAAAMLAVGVFAQECPGNACQAKPAPDAQEAVQKGPAARQGRRRPKPAACPCCQKADCPRWEANRPRPKADVKPGPKDGQGPRGPKMRGDRRPGGPEADKTPAERAAALRARAAELEKRAAALEAKAAKAPEEE